MATKKDITAISSKRQRQEAERKERAFQKLVASRHRPGAKFTSPDGTTYKVGESGEWHRTTLRRFERPVPIGELARHNHGARRRDARDLKRFREGTIF